LDWVGVLNGLDCFSGIGGITLALKEWVTPVAYCEINPYARAVLVSRMSDGQLPTAPIWDDVTTLHGDMLPVKPDIIYGGFPCQDISVAGRGAGLEGKRSGLFYEVARLVGEIRPAFVFLENVPAITGRGLGDVVGELARLWYDCRWGILSASDMGAPHRRDRWWLLAHAMCGIGSAKQGEQQDMWAKRIVGSGEERESSLANTTRLGWDSRGTREFIAHGEVVATDRQTDRRSRRLGLRTRTVRA
jgi:DNA (cytosine-5)-methyltransferase 1